MPKKRNSAFVSIRFFKMPFITWGAKLPNADRPRQRAFLLKFW